MLPSSAPTTASAMPAADVSRSPSVTSGACSRVDVTTFATATAESGSFFHADACPTPKMKTATTASSGANRSLLFIVRLPYVLAVDRPRRYPQVFECGVGQKPAPRRNSSPFAHLLP